MDDLHRLCTKLCRELAQCERSVVVHTRHEARRLGDVPPAHALLAIAEHAEHQRPRLAALMAGRRIAERRLRGSVAQLVSSLRRLVLGRLVESERSYRGTLLGMRHGADATRLLREVTLREGDDHLMRFCDEWLLDRLALIERAEQALAWFAERPTHAIRSGLRIALQPSK